jgi:hypothetical protein
MYTLYLCMRSIHIKFICRVVYPSEHNQFQDDSNDVNISNRDERSPSPFYNDQFIPPDDGANDPTFEESESSDFDPGDFDEHEQRDAALQAEWHTRTMALRALDQLESDPPSATGSDEELGDMTTNLSRIENIKFTQEFIEGIHTATFENGGLGDDIIHSLQNPCDTPTSISNPDVRLSLDLFLAVTNTSEQTYHACRDAILGRYPDSGILSYYAVKKLVAEITGVVAVYDDMCINSCHAFTGPFAELQSCGICGEARYDVTQSALTGKDVPRQQFCTILLGPQLQALRRSHSGATDMRYLDQKLTQVAEMLDNLQAEGSEDMVYDDIFSGSELQDLVERLEITGNDTIVSLSLDGAQLYQNKKSDTWISIWILNNFSPNQRYQKKRILPGTIIPGPNKPKITDSYLYRGIHHLSALQCENNGAGLRMWDAFTSRIIESRIVLALSTADAVGVTEIDGRVGHHGAHGCRLGCRMKGRHKPHTGHYFAVHLKPNNYTVRDCNHPDIDIRNLEMPSSIDYQQDLAKVIASPDQSEYEKNRKATGISKPTILSGLLSDLMIPVPRCFPLDLMHLVFINLGELLIPLWRGTMKCDTTDSLSSWEWVTLTGDVWQAHGRLVADATPFFPSSFHRPPRNPAEKISSGYKAIEYFHYLFGLGPGFFRAVLPSKYWKNFCKLVHGIRIIINRSITGSQLQEAHSRLVQFVEEFENLYYQRRVDRIHFCRPCLHTLLHTAPEVTRVGPGAYYTQFTMERTIGNLGQEIRQPSNPFANLARRALQRSQINALKSIYPELDPKSMFQLPRGAMDVGDGYIMLRPRDKYPVEIPGHLAAEALAQVVTSRIRRWGRARLPNGQVARSFWSEKRRTSQKIRVSRNVKVCMTSPL